MRLAKSAESELQDNQHNVVIHEDVRKVLMAASTEEPSAVQPDHHSDLFFGFFLLWP